MIILYEQIIWGFKIKAKERIIARRLRHKGLSLGDISSRIGCSKSSISHWVRDIPLTEGQILKLKTKQERGHARAANHPNSPKNRWKKIRDGIIDLSKKEIREKCNKEILKCIGAALYWGEGYKKTNNTVSFANTDPSMIKLMIRFFKEICGIPNKKFKAIVNVYTIDEIKKSEKYWSKISGIPLKQFHKIMLSRSKLSSKKKDKLPYGTFYIIICDVICCSKIKGWIEGIKGFI